MLYSEFQDRRIGCPTHQYQMHPLQAQKQQADPKTGHPRVVSNIARSNLGPHERRCNPSKAEENNRSQLAQCQCRSATVKLVHMECEDTLPTETQNLLRAIEWWQAMMVTKLGTVSHVDHVHREG